MVLAILHREQSCNDKFGLRLLEDLPLVPETGADGTLFRGGYDRSSITCMDFSYDDMIVSRWRLWRVLILGILRKQHGGMACFAVSETSHSGEREENFKERES
ncbi:hypothetical protein ASPBRDRAFT_38103 [Aspergillus brasiliensis CBS 101740]|uniref:Uncharacterized protein n=1 Tax=Aspergillus brasiliensis (strain CBS 101740 / IMI 381727 / IBT 21946) TaxID=767769 RepID=A0A1L9UW75_ASPBC|nr:hypothetical protein ASPBRDRAFT_38103 [Aspergillus brasiliensis CBS 101740]